MESISISVVITSKQPWPTLQEITQAALLQTSDCNGEVILSVASEQCLPPEGIESLKRFHENISAIVLPDADGLTLYAAGMGKAQGEIIAILEDHTMIQPDWCKRHRELYHQRPDIQAIACAVINGTAATLVDQANFLYGFSAYHPLAAPETPCRIPTVAGSSIRRMFIRDFPPQPGYVETTLYWEAYSTGVAFFDRENVVTHYQHRTFFSMLWNHANNGKSNAGFCRRYYTVTQWLLRFLSSLAAPLLSCYRWLSGNNRKNLVVSHSFGALPLLILIQAANAAGCICGLLFGVGNSGRHTD